jgi:hypothetical protein
VTSGCQIPAHLAASLLHQLKGEEIGLEVLAKVDSEIFNSLKNVIETEGAEDVLAMEFVYELGAEDTGMPSAQPLFAGGADVAVTDESKAEFVRLKTQHVLFGATSQQVTNLREGSTGLTPTPRAP